MHTIFYGHSPGLPLHLSPPSPLLHSNMIKEKVVSPLSLSTFIAVKGPLPIFKTMRRGGNTFHSNFLKKILYIYIFLGKTTLLKSYTASSYSNQDKTRQDIKYSTVQNPIFFLHILL